MKPGDVVLACEPFAYVVNQTVRKTTCDFCLRQPEEASTLKKCSNCKYVYYCNKQCQRPAWDQHRPECTYLKSIGQKVPTDTVRLIARIIIKLRNGIEMFGGGSRQIAQLPDGAKRRFDDLMSHTKAIINDPCRIRAFDAFFGVLQECFRDCGGVPPKSEVLDIYGRVLINSFNLMNHEYHSIGIGLYLEASVFDHSCRPNATVVFEGRKLLVRCVRDGVEKFADLRISYCNLIKPRDVRRQELKEQYYFECECEACTNQDDDVEAMKVACMRCPSCSKGIPVKESQTEVEVSCTSCNSAVPPEHSTQYWALREKVSSVIFKNAGKHPDPMEMSGEFVEDMKPLFFPTEFKYLELLEHQFKELIAEEDWPKAIDIGKLILVAYEELYPKNDVNTAHLLLKLAKMLNLQCRAEEAQQLVTKAEDLLNVLYGPAHSFMKEALAQMKLEVAMGVQEDKARAGSGDGADRLPAINNQSG